MPNIIILSGGVGSFTFVGYAITDVHVLDLTSLSAGAIAAGDLCVICDWARDLPGGTATPSTVTPSGFTRLITTSIGTATACKGIISAKILDGSETTVSTMNDSEDGAVGLVFRPDQPFTAYAAQGMNGEATQGNPASQTIAANEASTTPVILIGHMAARGTISPRSVSPAMDEIADGTSHYVHYKIYNTAPQAHTYDMDLEIEANVMQSLYLTFT